MWLVVVGLQSGDYTLTFPGHTSSGSFSQSGDITKFQGEAEVTFDSQKYSASLNFNGKGPITIGAEVNTPLSIKKVSFDFNHSGSLMK